ncbi:FAD binding domain-containing protein [Lasiosphaeria miniovina]|uniref:Fumarate reductase n=1 Tax=Lasiosphaeria miniovina TaxID=1954250 RepID=A0AA40DW41_9PEZI|nr:FAD binding domain-containing protein [Lasiosphaeria miniovina]KAK0713898.1 FAD binding domain-containing protein [Lasiosphaeria miniovina]
MASPRAAEVIVVGSGLAGLTAALEALNSGTPKVCLLERAAKPGGNSIKASSGINGAPTRFQNITGKEEAEAAQSFLDDTIRSAGSRLANSGGKLARSQREALITTLTSHSAEAIEFLSDLGVDLSVVAQLGGHSHARTHRGSGKTPPGAAIVSTLLRTLAAKGNHLELMTGCEVTKLLTRAVPQSGPAAAEVTGVEFRKDGELRTLHGLVIFTAGGFAGDTQGLLAQYRPDLGGIPSTNEPRPGAHKILSDAGAQLVDMESVQIHPTGFIDPASPQTPLKFLTAEMLRGEGGILLYNHRRFVNELDTRERVSSAIMGLPPAAPPPPLRQFPVKLILDEGVHRHTQGHVGFYLWKGLMRKKKVSELDASMQAALADYAVIVRGDKSDELGRTAFGHWRLGVDRPVEPDDEVLVGDVTPIVHFTMGGALINEHAQVLASGLGDDPRPLAGLWAAGEITGGLHGDNRLGGSSLLECVVFGRIAGRQAAAQQASQKASIYL